MKTSTVKQIKQLCKQSGYAEVLFLMELPDGTQKEVKGTSEQIKRFQEETGAVCKDWIIRVHDDGYSPVLKLLH